MLESQQGRQVVEINHISYPIFERIMGFLYTGEFEFTREDESNSDNIVDLLRVADEEFLEDVKMLCEQKLIELC